MRRISSAASIVATALSLQAPTADRLAFDREGAAAALHPVDASGFLRGIQIADQCTDRCGVHYRQCPTPKNADCESRYFLCRQHCASS